MSDHAGMTYFVGSAREFDRYKRHVNEHVRYASPGRLDGITGATIVLGEGYEERISRQMLDRVRMTNTVTKWEAA